MHITIFTAGSQGDVQPCIMLGRGLQRAGFDVLLAAPQNFADLVQRHHLCFHPLRGDVQQIMAGETGRRFMESAGSNPIRSMLAMRKMIGPVAIRMAEDALEACHDADALVSLAVFAPFGKSIAEIRDIPLINVEPTPLLPTGAFPAAARIQDERQQRQRHAEWFRAARAGDGRNPCLHQQSRRLIHVMFQN